jgi:hypothetical protein
VPRGPIAHSEQHRPRASHYDRATQLPNGLLDAEAQTSPGCEGWATVATAWDEGTAIPRWVIVALWITLGTVLVSLIAVAAILLVRMRLITSGAPTDTELKALWAFMGVAFGAVVTLIGTLLTEQHNRRTHALAREAAQREELARERQQKLAEESENRLTLDTVAKLLEHITEEGQYAPKARIAGAIATMMQLRAGVVATRILGELWSADQVDSSTAVWLVDRVIGDVKASPEEVHAAIGVLAANAEKLVPAKEAKEQDFYEWPAIVEDSWPSELPAASQHLLMYAAIRTLVAREINFWRDRPIFPLNTIRRALVHEGEAGAIAANILLALSECGALRVMGRRLSDAEAEVVRCKAPTWRPAPWFTAFLSQFEPWVKGRAVNRSIHMPGSQPTLAGEPTAAA